MSARGNFEGKTIPTRRIAPEKVAEEMGLSLAKVKAVWPTYRKKLATVRDRRVKPGLDKKIVTAWNGLAIGAFAKGYEAFKDPRYRKAAQEAADFIWRKHRRPNWGLYRVSNAGKAEYNGVLDDYAFLADGLLDLFVATGDLKQLKRVKTLLAEANTHFSGPTGAWFFTQAEQEAPLGRQVVPRDSVRPSGISRLLRATHRMAALTGSDSDHSRVDMVLGSYATTMRGSGLGMAGWYDVALSNKGPFYEVIIAGRADDPTFQALQEVYSTLRPSWAVKIDVPAEGPSAEILKLLPPTRAKIASKGQARAYVCVRGTCNAPTGDPKKLRTQLLTGWHR
jgi:uncharacterized protein YyaL (SSP411 family)